jgi:hypothetical protein
MQQQQQQRIRVGLRRSDFPVWRAHQRHLLEALEALERYGIPRDHNVFIVGDQDIQYNATVNNDLERQARRFAEACMRRLLDPNTEPGRRLHMHLHTPAIDVNVGLTHGSGVVYVELADPLTDAEYTERVLAFTQGADPRLGADSLISTLPIELVRRIVSS